jgi:Winged helix DNA-binding domain
MHIGRARLTNQHIARPAFDDPAAVVRWLGAVQAQDYLGGLWAVGLRTRSATEASVEDAIARGEFVRTWPMRGTLHFVAAADVRWMLSLLAPRTRTATSARWRQLELDHAVMARSAKVAEKALVGGKRVRRDALYALWNKAGIATHDSRGLHILGHLAQTGLICFGPREGKQQTFTLVEEWLPTARPLERDVALGELARRYCTSHGPATLHDFSWWSGLTVTDARAGLDGVKSSLDGETLDGRTFWFSSSTASAVKAVYLLPAWDEFTVAYRDRADILDARFTRMVNAGGGVLKPVIVIGGTVVGTWQRTFARGKAVVRPAPFEPLPPAVKDALEAAARKYGRFLGARAEVAG